jgi:hypothetical protein
LNVAKLQQIKGASNAAYSHSGAGEVAMTVPLAHGSKVINTITGTRSKAARHRWIDDRSPMATVALSVLLVLVWMGALIGFYFLLARHF